MKKETLIILLLINFILFTKVSYSQNMFEFRLTNPQVDEYVYDGIELTNGSYLLSCSEISPSPTKVHLLKLSHSGNLIKSLEFNLNNQNSGFLKIFQLNPNLLLFVGYTYFNNRNIIWLYKSDTLLNEVESKTLDFFPNSLYNMDAILDESGNILCNGVVIDSISHRYAFIYKISSGLDSIQFSIYTDYQTLFKPSLLRKTNYLGYYFFVTGYRPISSNYEESILDLDNEFHIIQINGVPNHQMQYPNSKWINKRSFILTNLKDTNASEDRFICGILMDTSYIVKNMFTIGNLDDTIEWPGMWKNLDFFDTNSVYVGGTHNFCQWEFCHTLCWYSLTNMDSLLNVRWEKFYGGDANYTLYGITATSDGGCLLYGTIFDSTMTDERDIYIIKVNQDGVLGIQDNKSGIMSHDAIVYPNPGSDQLNIESGPQIFGSQFKLFTLDGKEVISQNLFQRKYILDVHSLSSGAYVWQITNQNKIIETGKWIKQ